MHALLFSINMYSYLLNVSAARFTEYSYVLTYANGAPKETVYFMNAVGILATTYAGIVNNL